MYTMTESIIVIDGKEYITYGIAGREVCFSDVSVDKAKTEEMLFRINNEKLEECHLLEFIIDELNR